MKKYFPVVVESIPNCLLSFESSIPASSTLEDAYNNVKRLKRFGDTLDA